MNALMNEELYGMRPGNPSGEDEMTVWQDEEFVMNNMENATFIYDVTKVSPQCVQATTQFKYGVLASQRHLWLKVTNMSAEASFVNDPGTSVSVVT